MRFAVQRKQLLEPIAHILGVKLTLEEL